MALDGHLGVTQSSTAPEPVNWDVSLDGKNRRANVANTDQAHPVLLAAAGDVPVIIGNGARQGSYPATVRSVDIDVIRNLLGSESVTGGLVAGIARGEVILSGMAGRAAFEQFLHNYNDRSYEVRIPNKLFLYDASTNPALKDKAGWAAATDPALYEVDPNLSGIQTGRNLKPVRDTNDHANAKSPDSFYVMGYQTAPDGQLRPANVVEYESKGGKIRYKDQYLFKYDSQSDGSDVVSIFKYRAADQARGPDNSDAVGTIAIGANHRPNILEGMTQYFRYKGQTYDIRKWGGAQLQLGADELSAKPKPPEPDASGRPNVPEQEIYFKGTTTQTIGNDRDQGSIILTERNHSLGPKPTPYSGEDAQKQTFLYAKYFYFYDPFGPNLPKALKAHVPTPYDR